MFADNDQEASVAFERWLIQGPSAPYNRDLIKDWKPEDKELLHHLASFMYREGRILGGLEAPINSAINFIAK